MKAMKLTLAVGIVLVSTSPAFSHFVKAALGFRLGYSPTEQGYGQHKGYGVAEKKAVGVQVLTGVNNGGWHGGMKASGSGYGVGIGGSGATGRSIGGGPLDAHVGHGAVKHLRILGLNLYLGGRAAHTGYGGYGGNHGHGYGQYSHSPPLVKKPIYNLVHQHQPQHHPNYLAALAKPISLGASVGSGVKPVVAHAPNGGKIVGGAAGVRAAVGTPGFGVGFNLGYKQGINTKSPLGIVFGLAGGPGKYYSPISHKGPIYKGHDQVYIPGGGVLKGHGHDIGYSPAAAAGGDVSYTPAIGEHSPFSGFGSFSGLESKQHANTQPFAAASNTQTQPQTQASQQQQQRARAPTKHQGLQGPLALPSSYPRNPLLALFQSRPSILRPSPLQYTFNSPQSLPSGPIRMVLSPHPPTPAPQRPHSASNDISPPSWSTLFPIGGGPQHAPTNSFINPLPPNGQPLAKLQETLRPGNPFHQQQQQSSPVTSAQNQLPFVHQQTHHQPQNQYQGGFFPQALQSQGQFQPIQSSPQNNFQQFFSNGFQQQAAAAPQFPQEFNLFQQSPLQSFQSLPQNNFQQSSLSAPQQSSFFNQIQEQPVQVSSQSTAQSKQTENYPSIPQLPFTPDSMQFAPEDGFQYSHSTVSEPVKMSDYTMHMDMTNNGGGGGHEQSPAGSEVPLYGPMGRRLKKAKKPRQDIIVKKQGSAEAPTPKSSHDMMDTSASNTITLASSLGATSWTPMKIVDPPKLEKKSLETPVSTTLQVVNKKQPQSSLSPSTPTGGSAILTGPSPALGGPQEHNSDRTMILKKRRLNLSSAEVLNTVIPTMPSSLPSSTIFTSSVPSSTSTSSTTTTTTTTTTTVAPPSSSSSSEPSPSSSSSVDPSPTPDSTSQSSLLPVTTTTVVGV